MKKYTFIFICLLLSNLIISAQNTDEKQPDLKIGAEIRPRTEINHGYKTLALQNQTPSIITTQRTRLNFQYTSKQLITKLVLQDVRTWGNQAQLVANEDFATSVHEAWAEILFTDKISFKAGRMEIVYDDHRIFGNVGWAQQARSHDAAILKFTQNNFHLHIGGALYNQNLTNNFYDGPNAYKAIQFVHFNYNPENINVSLLFLNNGKSENKYGLNYFNILLNTPGTRIGQNTVYSQTLGGSFRYNLNNLYLKISGYYQMGKNPADWAVALDSIPNNMSIENNTNYKTSAGQGQKIRAYELNAELGYNHESIGISAGVEILSGNNFSVNSVNGQVTDGNNYENAFTPFYGTNHKFNGWMDYFYVNNHLSNVGLTDIYTVFSYKKNKTTAKLYPHVFLTSGTGAYSVYNTQSGNYDEIDYKGLLGTEIDLTFGYKLSDNVKIQAGYSMMLASDNMKILKLGTPDTPIASLQSWTWLMITVTPSMIIRNFERK